MAPFSRRHDLTLAERFAERTGPPTPSGCLPWLGEIKEGYGRLYIRGEGRRVSAHRLAWFLATGEWPSETIDHECHNDDLACRGGVTCPHRRCVNVAHMADRAAVANTLAAARPRALTPSEAMPVLLDGAGHGSETHCPRGHVYDEANTYIYPGRRMRLCRVCHREDMRARRAAARA